MENGEYEDEQEQKKKEKMEEEEVEEEKKTGTELLRNPVELRGVLSSKWRNPIGIDWFPAFSPSSVIVNRIHPGARRRQRDLLFQLSLSLCGGFSGRTGGLETPENSIKIHFHSSNCCRG